jgi:hypothetical protein
MEHFIPDDDFVHVADMTCRCGPQIHTAPSIGGGVAHRAIYVSDEANDVLSRLEIRSVDALIESIFEH